MATQALESKAISYPNEKRVMVSAIQGIESVLDGFLTTQTQDRELLSQLETLSERMKLIVFIRMQSKEHLDNVSVLLLKQWEAVLLRRALPGGETF